MPNRFPPAIIALLLAIAAWLLANLALAQTDEVAPADGSQKPPLPDAATETTTEEEFGATAQVVSPTSGATHHNLSQEQVQTMAGTGGDAVRAIAILPGVARGDGDTPFFRGSASDESQVFLDGAPVPLLFHLGGATSFFNSQFLESVEVHPGNFSVKYGRATGGIVDIKTRKPRTDRLHSTLQLSLLDSSALIETPVTSTTSMFAGVRRSNLELYFDHLVPKDVFSTVAAPVYYDYQGLVRHELNRDRSLEVMAYGSRDSLHLRFDEPNAASPVLSGDLEGLVEFHRLSVRSHAKLSESVNEELSVAFGKQLGVQTFGPWQSHFSTFDASLRALYQIAFGGKARLDTGVDVQSFRLVGSYYGPPPTQNEGNPVNQAPPGTVAEASITDTIVQVAPAWFAELTLPLSRRFTQTVGLRTDYYSNLKAWTVNPRLSTRYEIDPDSSLIAASGLFSQPPIYYQALENFTNPNLSPFHAWQQSLGIERRLGGLKLTSTGFYKRLYQRVVGTAGGEPPVFENNGAGRIYGAELGAEGELTERLRGSLAYTVSRSERRDRNESWRLFDNDQPHVLSLVGSYKLGRGWTLGTRFRLTSGNPSTDIVGSVYDARIDQYRPLYAGINTNRSPTFHQLDLRADKEFDLGAIKLSTFLEVMNAYNAPNAQGYTYSFDYKKREPARGMPIFPNFGLRGEL
ncbi:MAG: TonB-dependent receptor [Polyangiaceae bacterium]|nr:TonB-dependent receptor [Polyangiaceae bacterium]